MAGGKAGEPTRRTLGTATAGRLDFVPEECVCPGLLLRRGGEGY